MAKTTKKKAATKAPLPTPPAPSPSEPDASPALRRPQPRKPEPSPAPKTVLDGAKEGHVSFTISVRCIDCGRQCTICPEGASMAEATKSANETGDEMGWVTGPRCHACRNNG